jgi:hypothetical protein
MLVRASNQAICSMPALHASRMGYMPQVCNSVTKYTDKLLWQLLVTVIHELLDSLPPGSLILRLKSTWGASDHLKCGPAHRELLEDHAPESIVIFSYGRVCDKGVAEY